MMSYSYYPGVESYELEVTAYCGDCDHEFEQEVIGERGIWTATCPKCNREIEGEE
jgi:Zn finger protein HypA/HybF involved in hydrogenase expression